MNTPRLDFRRRPKGPVLLTLFGVSGTESGALTAEAAYVPLPILRTVKMQAGPLNVRVQPVKWTGLSAENSFLEQLGVKRADKL